MRDTRKKHGLTTLMRRVKANGMSAVDGRTVAARAVLQWKSELLAALGGVESVSPQRLALVEMAIRTRLFVDHLDAWLMQQGSLINRRKKTLLPVVMQRQTLCDSLARLLGQLGLDRQARPVPALSEYLRAKETR